MHDGEVDRLHHIGWAVRSLEDARHRFEHRLGLRYDGTERFPTVDVAFYDAGNCLIELLEPTDGSDPVASFLERRGEGVHHLAYEVPSVAAALEGAAARGLEPLDRAPRRGARGTTIGFVDPGSDDRILLEYVEVPA